MKTIDDVIEDLSKDNEIINTFEPKDFLSDDIFDKDGDSYTLKEEVREKLLENTNEFLSFLGINFFIYDIHFTGSLSNYNWSKYSDLDIHIIIDLSEFSDGTQSSKIYDEIVREFFELKKKSYQEKNIIKIKGYDIEFYVQDIDEEGVSSGIYSILNDEWVKEPKKTEPIIDKKKILKKSEEFTKLIDDLNERATKGENVIKKVDVLKNKIKKFRQCGLEKGGEYSYENLTFKLLRRNGMIEKLMSIKSTVRTKNLSLTQ
jgi:predicted transcriptional regulator